MNDPSALEIRRARADDWDAIWTIFRSIVASGDTYAYAPDITEAEARAAWLHVDEHRTVTFVAVADGDVIGTALLKPNLPGLGDHVANAGWMIDPRSAGNGYGRRFAHVVMDEARRMGFEAMQFNAVVASNDRALGLWRSMGFDVVGTVPGAFRHATDGQTGLHIMHRFLSE